jgi:hypothetical protein
MRVLIGLAVSFGLLAGGAEVAPEEQTATRACPEVCTMIYDPVTCRFDSGATMTFGNRCVAEAYACRHHLNVVSCGPKAG